MINGDDNYATFFTDQARAAGLKIVTVGREQGDLHADAVRLDRPGLRLRAPAPGADPAPAAGGRPPDQQRADGAGRRAGAGRRSGGTGAAAGTAEAGLRDA